MNNDVIRYFVIGICLFVLVPYSAYIIGKFWTLGKINAVKDTTSKEEDKHGSFWK